MRHARANNWRAMRAVYGRPSAHRSTELFGAWLAAIVVAGFAVGMVLLLVVPHARARDLDGRHAQSPLKSWFDKLKSGRGPCCSNYDGLTITDADWNTDNGRYRVRIEGHWIVVPDDADVTEPNRYGPAVVWPMKDNGVLTVRCFMPGALT
jgi:hypothetical protein